MRARATVGSNDLKNRVRGRRVAYAKSRIAKGDRSKCRMKGRRGVDRDECE